MPINNLSQINDPIVEFNEVPKTDEQAQIPTSITKINQTK